MAPKLVSIILPCYNESGHLLKSIRALLEESKKFSFPFEFIFVEDKSTDDTREVLQKVELDFKNGQFVYHEKNQGRGAAVKSGFAAAKGDIVGFIDIDLEVSPRYITEFVEALRDHDVAIANRKYYSDSVAKALVRDTLSDYYHSLSKKVLKHGFSDTEAGYKFFRKEPLIPFFNSSSDDHWFWDTEFIMFCFNNKLKVAEVEVDFLRDNSKKSTVKVVSDSFYYLRKLLRYKKQSKS